MVDAGELAPAQERLREALLVYGLLPQPEPIEVATTRFTLARSMVLLRQDRAEALALAEAALAALPKPDEKKPDEDADALRAEIRRWLDDERRRR